mgnify:CR=1 FL=1
MGDFFGESDEKPKVTDRIRAMDSLSRTEAIRRIERSAR